VQGQPNWSDFPFVLLTFRHSPFDSKFVEMLVNAAVLERPFHPLSLAAAVRSALRARRRQKGAEALLLEHERVAARQKVLIRELHHRVRNMLATIQGVMSVTSRASGNVRDFTLAFSERLQSLARTHQLLTDDTFQSASLLDLLQQELQPYADSDARRFSLEGPPVDLPSILAVPFGMAVHELATNSIKYGALSAPSGRLSITWAVGGRGDDRELTFKWVETGGPEVRPPARNGFGTVLITRVLAPQSRAEVSMDYDPQGLIFEMRAPLA
jgi:two-component sensor histidine kinase